MPGGIDATRFDGRRGLLDAFDGARRDVDASGLMDGLDRFSQEAYTMVSGPAARAAFDIRKESPRLRDRYGRHTWGQSALMARRLVEAGVRFVTLTFGGWDYHSSIEVGMKNVLPVLDKAVGSLVDDLSHRGMLESTVVLVMGEFGRGPRINQGLPNDKVPGRDHWGEVMSVLVAGGGFAQGQSHRRVECPGRGPQGQPGHAAGPARDALPTDGDRPRTQLQEPRRPADLDRIDGADHQGTLLTDETPGERGSPARTARSDPLSGEPFLFVPGGAARPPITAMARTFRCGPSVGHPRLPATIRSELAIPDDARLRPGVVAQGRVHLQRRGAVHRQLVDVGRELVLAVEHLVAA